MRDARVVQEYVEEAGGVSIGDGGVLGQSCLDESLGDGEWTKGWMGPGGGRQVGGLVG